MTETFIQVFKVPRNNLIDTIKEINQFAIENQVEILQHQVVNEEYNIITNVSVLFRKPA